MAGCSCPNNNYLDASNEDKPQCVKQSQCSCYDSESKTYISAGTTIAKACGNW